MKKKNLQKLTFTKTTVSNLKVDKISGGSITTFRFICTNHPKQETDFCDPTGYGHTCGCANSQGDYSCQCTIA